MRNILLKQCSLLSSLLLYVIAIAEEEEESHVAFRIREKFNKDLRFRSLWKDLISLQEHQTAQHEALHYYQVYQQLETCGRVLSLPDRVDVLRPEDIDIYTDIGHLSTYCQQNTTKLLHGEIDSCIHHSSYLDLITVDKLIQHYNPNLTVVNTHRKRGDTLFGEAKRTASSIQNIENYELKWKLILIIPSIQDGEASETGQAAVEVLTTIEELQKALPKRTFIVVLRNSGKGIWKDASHAHEACRIMLSRWETLSHYNMDTVWDQVDLIVRKNFQNPEFAVEILPTLNDAALTQLPNGTDLSALAFDCAHFSERGLSLLHQSIWNSLLTRSSSRTHHYRPTPEDILCPDPRCPFLRTASNSVLCIWNPILDNQPSVVPQLIVIGVLTIALLLCIFLAVFLCSRNRNKVIKGKAFGSSLSSIRFIDDDIT